MPYGSRGASQLHTGTRPVLAALDLGTNNCRLLIAEQTGPERFEVLDSFSRIVRLGEGLGQRHELSDEAVARTVEALKICARKLSRFELTAHRYVATEACRLAKNCEDFLITVHSETGMIIEIISHEEEARLAFRGCLPLLRDGAEHTLMVDIGGGSTEFMWAQIRHPEPEIRHILTSPCGVMALTEKFAGLVNGQHYKEAKAFVRDYLKAFGTQIHAPELFEHHAVQLLCTSGTVTTVAAVFLELEYYDRARIDGLTLPVEKLRQAIEGILAMSPAERNAHPCIGPERGDFMVAGCAVLDAVLDAWPVKELTIGDRGVREGIILRLMQENGDTE